MTVLSAHAIAAASPTHSVNHDAAHPAPLRESTGEGICGFERDGRCTSASRASEQPLGDRTDSVPGRNMHQRVHHTHADRRSHPGHGCPIVNADRQGLPCRLEHKVLRHADGSCFDAGCSSCPVIEGGEGRGAVVTFAATGERKQQQRALKAMAARVDGAASPSSRTIHDSLEMSA